MRVAIGRRCQALVTAEELGVWVVAERQLKGNAATCRPPASAPAEVYGRRMDWPIAAGIAYGYAVLLAGFIMPRLMTRVGTRHGTREQWYRAGLGFVEQIVTVSAVLVGRIELVLGWVAFKIALRWGGWGSEPGLFNRYAIGTVVSMGFSAAGGTIAIQLHRADHLLDVLPTVGLIGMSPLVVAGWIALLYDGRSPDKNRWRRWWDPDVPSDGPAAQLPTTWDQRRLDSICGLHEVTEVRLTVEQNRLAGEERPTWRLVVTGGPARQRSMWTTWVPRLPRSSPTP